MLKSNTYSRSIWIRPLDVFRLDAPTLPYSQTITLGTIAWIPDRANVSSKARLNSFRLASVQSSYTVPKRPSGVSNSTAWNTRRPFLSRTSYSSNTFSQARVTLAHCKPVRVTALMHAAFRASLCCSLSSKVSQHDKDVLALLAWDQRAFLLVHKLCLTRLRRRNHQLKIRCHWSNSDHQWQGLVIRLRPIYFLVYDFSWMLSSVLNDAPPVFLSQFPLGLNHKIYDNMS